jgi:hypothetical protein
MVSSFAATPATVTGFGAAPPANAPARVASLSIVACACCVSSTFETSVISGIGVPARR